MWFDVEAVPLAFTESSPYHIENVVRIEASPERVFEIWATGERQRDWFKDFVDNRWTSPAPYGVGSEREVELALLTVKEPGKRMTFHIYGITLPLVTAMVEDLRLEPDGAGATRMTWRVHYRPSLLMRLVHPVGRAIFGRLFRLSAEGLVRYAKEHPRSPS